MTGMIIFVVFPNLVANIMDIITSAFAPIFFMERGYYKPIFVLHVMPIFAQRFYCITDNVFCNFEEIDNFGLLFFLLKHGYAVSRLPRHV